MPRTSTRRAGGNVKAPVKKRTPRPKKKVVAFLVSDENDDYGFMVKTADEVGDAIKRIRAKLPSWKKAEGFNNYDYNIRCVAEDGTIKCGTLTIEASVIKAEVKPPAGMTL